jgi:hypothetical protein
VKHIKVAFYGLIADIPEEGVEVEGESMILPFSSAEPPYTRTEADGSVTYLDWIAILDIIDNTEKS